MKKYLDIPVTEKEGNREIYQVLRYDLGFSQTKIKSVKFDPEGIFLNGERVNVRTILKEGDLLRVLLDDSGNRTENLYPVEMPLTIIYEDDSILVLLKPSGVVCHPSKGHYFDSLSNGVRYYLNQKGEHSQIHLYGRLDKDTSGLLLFAKNSVVLNRLKQSSDAGLFRKEYIAIVSGIPEQKEDTIRIPMVTARDADGMLKMTRAERATPETEAETSYRVISEYPDSALLRVTIRTGRTHQIRFHMSETGHPLLGDAVYGNGPEKCFSRSALHAEKLTFPHPMNGDEIQMTAPMPEDFLAYVSRNA